MRRREFEPGRSKITTAHREASKLRGCLDDEKHDRARRLCAPHFLLDLGLDAVAGAARNGDQEYNAQGTVTYLSMIVLLTGTALVLPKFTSGAGEFTKAQAIVMSLATATLYAAFLWKQMTSHRRLFIQPARGGMFIPATVTRGNAVVEAGSDESAYVIDKPAVSD